VRPEPGFFVQVWGTPTYHNPGQGQPITPITFGSDGITLSADGETLYYCAVSERYFYSVPTKLLRSQSPSSELLAAGAVQTLTPKGVSDGLESDTNDIAYAGSFETNSIVTFNPANGTVQPFVRDLRIDWTDTMSVSADGYLYFTENQLFPAPSQQGGTGKRVKPFQLYRVPLPNEGKKIMLNGGANCVGNMYSLKICMRDMGRNFCLSKLRSLVFAACTAFLRSS
jgi:sugar lactone lactonase YvrE